MKSVLDANQNSDLQIPGHILVNYGLWMEIGSYLYIQQCQKERDKYGGSLISPWKLKRRMILPALFYVGRATTANWNHHWTSHHLIENWKCENFPFFVNNFIHFYSKVLGQSPFQSTLCIKLERTYITYNSAQWHERHEPKLRVYTIQRRTKTKRRSNYFVLQ